MTDLQIFQNDAFGQVRTLTRDGEPWFVAADVCRALEIGNPSMALSRLDEDEQALISIEGISRGNDLVNLINEPGLYTLVLGSRKLEAKAFKRWLTHEVIPTIRKTGKYEAVPETRLSPKEEAAMMRSRAMTMNAQTRQFTSMTKGIKDSDKLLRIGAVVYGMPALAELAKAEVVPVPRQPSVTAPVVETAKPKTSWSATEIAEMYGVTAQKVGRLANLNRVKREEYGTWTQGQSPYSAWVGDMFMYNQKGVDRIGELLGSARTVA